MLLFLVCFYKNYAQDIPFITVYTDSIKENSNAIIKENLVEIEITSYDKIKVNTKRVITILNEYGMRYLDASEYFDKSTSIKNIEAKIYNSLGTEIKKIKQKDFRENSVSEGSIITDNRVMYLDYTPTQYPFTMVYTSEVVSSNTAFIPSWSPVDNYFVSTISSKITLKYADEVKLKYKEFNFDNRIKKVESKNYLEFSVNNIIAVKAEELSPSTRKFLPYVMFGLDEFSLEGIKGYANDWNTFGKWMYTNLLSDTEEISELTKQKLQTLIGQEKDKIEIAKIIYKYVQDKTRYVSIQLGIGGWRPMFAKDVDRLGYGDCKALTNYTRSLLKTFNIPSYYTIVYSGRDNKQNIKEDFVSMQGNHVILGIPDNNEIQWLECTSQTSPFGFQGSFTDDRNVLIISEDKSEIVKTKAFNNESNVQKTKATITYLSDNSIVCDLNISSKGMEFDEKYFLANETPENKTLHYKDRFSQINNLKIEKTELQVDKNKIELNEILKLKAIDYIKHSGDRIILTVNAINQVSYIPKKYKQRNNPFEIERGYQYIDEYELFIPEGFNVEAMVEGNELTTKFGTYKSTLEQKQNKLIYQRTFTLNKGFYDKSAYNQYREFRENIAKFENMKIVLIKK